VDALAAAPIRHGGIMDHIEEAGVAFWRFEFGVLPSVSVSPPCLNTIRDYTTRARSALKSSAS